MKHWKFGSALGVTSAVCALAVVGSVALPASAQQGKAPFAGGAAQAGAEDPAVTKLEAEATKLAKQYKAKPKDAKLKKSLAEAYYKAGHTAEYSEKLGPRVKYRDALKNYRLALSVDPTHVEAAKEKKQIEDIYKSMGRPVPK